LAQSRQTIRVSIVVTTVLWPIVLPVIIVLGHLGAIDRMQAWVKKRR
jgi:hypothetical protein